MLAMIDRPHPTLLPRVLLMVVPLLILLRIRARLPLHMLTWKKDGGTKFLLTRMPLLLLETTLSIGVATANVVKLLKSVYTTKPIGLGSETGEFVEIVKKMVLQGKPASDDNIFHMKRELGDIMWYWTTACASLGLDPFEVISENQKKLEARYGEKFEVERSEVRKEGDL